MLLFVFVHVLVSSCACAVLQIIRHCHQLQLLCPSALLQALVCVLSASVVFLVFALVLFVFAFLVCVMCVHTLL